MALKSATRSAQASTSSSRVLRPAAAGSRHLVVRAAADNSVPAARSPPVLEWPVDNETAKDVFAFAGSLPERLNGRMAMLGFAGIALAELKEQTPAGEQLAGDVFGVLLLSITFTLASLFPKFSTGRPLKELHAAATSENLRGDGIQQALALFDTNTELWTGRVAMIGVAGLFVTEAITGKVIF